MYIFDTDSLSDIVKSRPSPRFLKNLKGLPSEFQYPTSINVAEIYYGAFRSTKTEKILRAFEEMVFPNVTVLPFDEEIAQVYGQLKAKLEKRGITKSEPDLRIASIALQHKFTLVSGNIRHFKDIPRLKIENWLEQKNHIILSFSSYETF
jgi:tRNA(fMet)-specific endonuclease VapC